MTCAATLLLVLTGLVGCIAVFTPGERGLVALGFYIVFLVAFVAAFIRVILKRMEM